TATAWESSRPLPPRKRVCPRGPGAPDLDGRPDTKGPRGPCLARPRARPAHGDRRRGLSRGLALPRRSARFSLLSIPPLSLAGRPRPRFPLALQGTRCAGPLRDFRGARPSRPGAPEKTSLRFRLDLLASEPARAWRRIPLRFARALALCGRRSGDGRQVEG